MWHTQCIKVDGGPFNAEMALPSQLVATVYSVFVLASNSDRTKQKKNTKKYSRGDTKQVPNIAVSKRSLWHMVQSRKSKQEQVLCHTVFMARVLTQLGKLSRAKY